MDEMSMRTTFYSENFTERDCLGDLDTDERIILK
jgi:hypothetical protein